MRCAAWAAVPLLLVVPPVVLCADPVPIQLAGCTVQPLADHATVRLEAERLLLEPDAGGTRVTAMLSFHNDGPATEVQMGFPITNLPGNAHLFVRDFTVEVDGEAVALRELEGEIELHGESRPADWHVFSVPMEADARRQMVVRYAQTGYLGSDQRLTGAPYVLGTGGAWAGPIRELTVEVRLDDQRNLRDLRLQGDGGELALTTEGEHLAWRCADFEGTPQELLLSYDEWRPDVTVNGDRTYAGQGIETLRWADGELWGEVGWVCDALLCVPGEAGDGGARLEKEGRGVTVPVRTSPRPAFYGVGGERRLVPLQRVCEALGCALALGTDADGQVQPQLTTPAGTPEGLLATALYPAQKPEYRLQCLRRLAEDHPQDCAAACREIIGRDREAVAPVLWALGHLTEEREEPALIERAARALSAGTPPSADELAQAVGDAKDDTITHGGALLLARLPGGSGAVALLERLRHQQGQESMYSGGLARAVGLALRKLSADWVCGRLQTLATEAPESGVREAALVCLGYLGDPRAIPLLQSLAAGERESSPDERASAAHGLAAMGNPEVVPVLTQLAIGQEWRGVSAEAMRGLKWMAGLEQRQGQPSWITPPLTTPGWAGRVGPAAAREVVVPALERIAAEAADQERTGHEARAALEAIARLEGVAASVR